jgi:hypothetical protein
MSLYNTPSIVFKPSIHGSMYCAGNAKLRRFILQYVAVLLYCVGCRFTQSEFSLLGLAR